MGKMLVTSQIEEVSTAPFTLIEWPGMRWLNLTRITPYIEKLTTPLTANTINDS